jgi:hypothetical protein
MAGEFMIRYNTPYLRIAQALVPGTTASTWLVWRPYAIHIDRERWDRLTVEQQERLIGHEQVHITQREQDGIWFLARYMYYHCRYGYRGNPYEVEAYSQE